MSLFEMSIAQCLAILRARWKGALAVFLLAVGSTIAVSLLLPKQYTATASVVVDFKPDPVSSMMVAGLASPGFMGTQVDVLQSDRVLRRAIQALRLAENPDVREQWLEETGGQGSIESWLLEPIRKQMEVRPSRDSGVIAVSYRAADPNFAAVAANAIVQAYLETSLALNVGPAKASSSFFDSRAKEARAVLESAQARLSTFQRERGIIATDERLDVENARLNDLSSQAVMLQALASESASRQVQARGASADKLQEVLANPVVGSLKAELARSEVRLQEYRARLGDNHPQVLETKANIQALRARIDAETQRVTAGVGVSDSIARQRDADVRAALEAQRNKVLRMKAVRDEGAVLLRDVESAQRALELLTGRLNQTTLESQIDADQRQPAERGRAADQALVAQDPAECGSGGAAGRCAGAGRCLAAGTDEPPRAQRRGRFCGPGPAAAGIDRASAKGRRRGRERASLAQQRMIGLRRSAPGRERRAGAFGPSMPAWPDESSAHARCPRHRARRCSTVRSATCLPRRASSMPSRWTRSSSTNAAPACVSARPRSISACQHRRRAARAGASVPLPLCRAGTACPEPRTGGVEPAVLGAGRVVPGAAQPGDEAGVQRRVARRHGRWPWSARTRVTASPTVAANLAVTLAQLGGRTLLVDADLRGPRQHEVFNLDNTVGLAGILSGRVDGPVVRAGARRSRPVAAAGGQPAAESAGTGRASRLRACC